jgi:hypothetical protein
MESVLNLIWVLLSVALVRLWVIYAPREGPSRRTQIAAMAMLILLLFPVISVTDDLQAAQNIAEDDIYLRRDHSEAGPHFISIAFAAIPTVFIADLSCGYQRLAAPSYLPAPTVDNPALAAIQNRPPPAA